MFSKRRSEADLNDELRAYLELLVAEKVRTGLSASEARRLALAEIGGIEQVKENCRDVRRGRWLEDAARDARHAMRMLTMTPSFTAVVVLILTLGIGANTAAFSVLNAIAFKPLPVSAPEELVWFDQPSFSYPIFQEVRARGKDVFKGVLAWNIDSASIQWSDGVRHAPVLFVSENFYSVLGVTAAAGRLISAGDDVTVAILSYQAWRDRFASDAGVIGTRIRIDRVPFTIVGIAPRGFFGVSPGLAPEITVPLAAIERIQPQEDWLRAPHKAWLHMLARLRPGTSRAQADAAVQSFWPGIMEDITPQSMPAPRRAMFLQRQTALMPGASGFSRIARQFSQPLAILLCLAGLLLLAACATFANLLLVRAAARNRETAVRLAIGATRGRVIRQLLAETLLLTGAGAIGGLLFAKSGSSLLVSIIATSTQTVVADLSLDTRVLLFTMALWLLTAGIAVTVPAWRAAAIDPVLGLKESPRSVGVGRRGSQVARALAIAQIALAVLMVSGASLFVFNLRRISQSNAGFDHRNVLLVRVDPVLAGYAGERALRYYANLQQRLGAIPGAESVSLSWVPPVSNEMGAWTQSIGVDGPAPDAPGKKQTFMNVISPRYFQTVGQKLLRGRDFEPRDDASTERVCIVSESLARTYFGDVDPIGRRVTIGRAASRQDLTIVGIVEDAKYRKLTEPMTPTAYFPYAQSSDFVNTSNLMAEVRAAVAPASLIETIRREVTSIDPEVMVRFETLAVRIRESLVVERAVAIVSGFLGLVALILASAGLYGLLAYTVSRRTGEIGIRIALGAARSAVERLVLKDCLVLAVCGIAIGMSATLALGRFAAGLLHGVKPRDPVTLGFACLLMLVVALFAGWLPARRAARVDPMTALRAE